MVLVVVVTFAPKYLEIWIAISLYDSDEKYLDAQIKSDSMIGQSFRRESDNTRDDDALQDHLRQRDSIDDEDDIY